MSSSASDINLGTIGAAAGIPTLNVADVPANIRNGDKAAQQAYAEGLAFESVLVNELTQQMAKTMDGSGLAGASGGAGASGSLDGSGGSAGGSSDGLLGAAGAYSSLIPQALTSSIMSGGGLGLAEQFAEDLDPALKRGPEAG
jgi:Rod binding domain-containing protein